MTGPRRLDRKAQRGIDLSNVAWRLAQEAELRELGAIFADADVHALYLPRLDSGPDQGQRSLDQGSASIDVLVPPPSRALIHDVVVRNGWVPVARRAAIGGARYAKGESNLDVHGSIRSARLVPRRLRHLERALWDGAAVGSRGMLEPRAEPLFVFRAVQAASIRPGAWNTTSGASSSLYPEPLDADEVSRIAQRSRLGNVLSHAQRNDPLRFVPGSIRGRVREAVAMRTAGYGLIAGRGQTSRAWVDDLPIDVSPGVFAPRLPIASTMIATSVDLSGHLTRPIVVEVGTACGAIALGYASQRPDARVIAVDISYRAVACARRNRDRLGLSSVRIAHSDLLDALPDRAIGTVDLVVANIPYIPPATAPRTDWGAPVETVQGTDQDGLGLILRLAHQATGFLRPGGTLILQLTGWQWETLAAELKGIGYEPLAPQAWGDEHAAVGCAVWQGDVAPARRKP